MHCPVWLKFLSSLESPQLVSASSSSYIQSAVCVTKSGRRGAVDYRRAENRNTQCVYDSECVIDWQQWMKCFYYSSTIWGVMPLNGALHHCSPFHKAAVNWQNSCFNLHHESKTTCKWPNQVLSLSAASFDALIRHSGVSTSAAYEMTHRRSWGKQEEAALQLQLSQTRRWERDRS